MIDLKFDGSLARIAPMEPVDICILFSNLIDNAMEELAKIQGNRYFYVSVTESPNMTMIILKNNMSGELVLEGNSIKTSKEDALNHGIGLQNVKEIVSKYNGEYTIETKNREFVIKVILPM
ncbi:MAG: sensor histidine kinase [Lachnospiraceae bacterium]|nr:sensor histidine kinase [Lachnospiraceae bacterium]